VYRLQCPQIGRFQDAALDRRLARSAKSGDLALEPVCILVDPGQKIERHGPRFLEWWVHRLRPGSADGNHRHNGKDRREKGESSHLMPPSFFAAPDQYWLRGLMPSIFR